MSYALAIVMVNFEFGNCLSQIFYHNGLLCVSGRIIVRFPAADGRRPLTGSIISIVRAGCGGVCGECESIDPSALGTREAGVRLLLCNLLVARWAGGVVGAKGDLGILVCAADFVKLITGNDKMP